MLNKFRIWFQAKHLSYLKRDAYYYAEAYKSAKSRYENALIDRQMKPEEEYFEKPRA